ncbi:MAG: PAS domain S-box protein, partial [Candidatus Limnocylindrales bacterium]
MDLGAALEQTNDGVMVVDATGIVTYANRAFLTSHGLTRQDLIGHDARDLGVAPLGPDGLADLLASSATGITPGVREVASRGPDGAARHLQISVTPVGDSAGAATSHVVVSHDVTALRAAEAQLERRRVLAAAVAEVDRDLLHLTDAAEVARDACRVIVETGIATMAWVGLAEPGSHRLMPIGSYGDEGYLDAITVRADVSPLGRGPVGESMRRGEPVNVTDIRRAPEMAPWRNAAARFGYRSVVSVPLRHGGTTSGALTAYGPRPGAFGTDEIAVLAQLGSDVSFAIAAIEQAARRRDVESALIASERRFREALFDVALPAVMLDTDGSILFTNRHLLDLTGWKGQEVYGQDWFALFVTPDERAVERATYLHALEHGSIPPRWRERLLQRSGETREIEWSSAYLRDAAGSIVGMAGLGHDVTGREEARAALESSETRLRTALDTMLDGVTVMSAIRDASGHIVDFRSDYANLAIANLSLVTANEQAGRTLLQLFPAHRTDGLFDAYVRVVETGVPFESGSVRYIDPDAA